MSSSSSSPVVWRIFFLICSLYFISTSSITTDAAAAANINVYGNDLESCSQSGMAVTGYTRNGQCIDQDGDNGSYHICINLSSTKGRNFCKAMEQNDWCSSSMACDGGDTNSNCPIQNWCVSQWTFAGYLHEAGGCDKIQDIVCEAINMEAIIAYKNQEFDKNSLFKQARNCITERCGI